MNEETKQAEELKTPEKTLQERVDFLEKEVRILKNRLSDLSGRINSSERSSRNHVDLY